MIQRIPCVALIGLLAAPPALAATTVRLTIYHANNDALFAGGAQGTLDAGHALVHEQRSLDLAAGVHATTIGDLPAAIDPEAISIDFQRAGGVSVIGQRVILANGNAAAALDGAIGSRVSVKADGTETTGTLLGASGSGLLVRTDSGDVRLFHQYQSVTLPAGSVSGGSRVVFDVDAKTAGTRNALLTYATGGLGWRAAYRVSLDAGAACRMQFKPEASIANRSGRDYPDATVTLIAGQPNLGTGGNRMYRVAAAPMAVQEQSVMPSQAPLGDYRSFTLPGNVNLPNGSVTLTPLYAARVLSCQRRYLLEDGNDAYVPPRPMTNDYGPQDYQDRPIASTLAFTAPEALPAGTLRAWTVDRAGAPALLGEGSTLDTPKGQRVSVELGQSFDLRASRERTTFKVDIKAHTMNAAFRIALRNGGSSARTVTVREHPGNRWREWTLTSSSIKPSKQTPQLLEFEVPVQANGSVTLSYAVHYAWTAEDMR